ncbi:hypothetical protein, partial [Azospirillum argentinense]
GSTFWFTFTADLAADGDAVGVAAPPLAGLSVLLLAADAEERRFLARYLNTDGSRAAGRAGRGGGDAGPAARHAL